MYRDDLAAYVLEEIEKSSQPVRIRNLSHLMTSKEDAYRACRRLVAAGKLTPHYGAGGKRVTAYSLTPLSLRGEQDEAERAYDERYPFHVGFDSIERTTWLAGYRAAEGPLRQRIAALEAALREIDSLQAVRATANVTTALWDALAEIQRVVRAALRPPGAATPVCAMCGLGEPHARHDIDCGCGGESTGGPHHAYVAPERCEGGH